MTGGRHAPAFGAVLEKREGDRAPPRRSDQPWTANPLLPARLRAFHTRLPLAGDPPNAVLTLPDDRLLYLVALLRDTPVRAPALLPGEWGEFRDLLNNPGRG